MNLDLIKGKLKKVPLLQEINATLKARVFHSEYEGLFNNEKSKFEFNCEVYTPNRTVIRTKNVGELVIIWVGVCYEQDYSGFRQALSNFGEVFDFYDVDNAYGLKFPKKRNKLIYDKEREENSESLLRLYEDLSKTKHVDLIMGQMWSTAISPQVFNIMRDNGTRVINIAMDDKLPIHWKTDKLGRMAGAIGLAGNVDLTLNTSKQAVQLYNKNKLPCIYWPLASDPGVFYSSDSKQYDIVFVGSNYGYRKKIIKYLLDSGINVEVFGPGFPSGMISAEKTADVFSKAKIVLGVGYVAYSKKICTLKLRDFDAMFTGALYITSRNEDLEEIFLEDKHIVYYDSMKSLVDKIKYYLDNEDERCAISTSAMHFALEKHNWIYRIECALKAGGVITDE